MFVRQLLAPGDVLQVGGQVGHHAFDVIQRPAAAGHGILPDTPVKELIEPNGLLNTGRKLQAIAACAQPSSGRHATARPCNPLHDRRPHQEAVYPEPFRDHPGHPGQLRIAHEGLDRAIAVRAAPVPFKRVELGDVAAEVQVVQLAA